MLGSHLVKCSNQTGHSVYVEVMLLVYFFGGIKYIIGRMEKDKDVHE